LRLGFLDKKVEKNVVEDTVLLGKPSAGGLSCERHLPEEMEGSPSTGNKTTHADGLHIGESL
jgi:hypothetical protein